MQIRTFNPKIKRYDSKLPSPLPEKTNMINLDLTAVRIAPGRKDTEIFTRILQIPKLNSPGGDSSTVSFADRYSTLPAQLKNSKNQYESFVDYEDKDKKVTIILEKMDAELHS